MTLCEKECTIIENAVYFPQLYFYLRCFMRKDGSFEHRLVESRIIPFCDGSGATEVIFSLLQYKADDPTAEIQLFISSYGGSSSDMMAVYDTIKTMPNPITAVAFGAIGGYANLILAACTKGRRFALPSTEFSIGQPHGYFSAGANQQTEVAIEAKKLLKEREDLEKALAEETGRSLELIHNDLEYDIDLNAEEAKKYGLIDEILYGRDE